MTQVFLTYSYVSFGLSGPHRRRPVRSPGGGPGGFTLIEQKSGGTLQTGDQFLIGIPLPATLLVEGATLDFSFINVSGGTPSGSQVSFDRLQPPPYVTVQSAPIEVLVLYVPAGGGRSHGEPGDSGATIDSFDESTGSLFNDVFVSVAPDAGGALTESANDLGFVATTGSAETITALSPTSSGVIFDQWRVLSPPSFGTGKELKVGQGVSVTALAFYKGPPPPSAEQQTCIDAVNSLQSIIEHRHPRLTRDQYTYIVGVLEGCVRAGFATQAEVDRLLQEYATIGVEEPPPRMPQV